MSTYKELSEELSEIMAQLQNGELPLDDAISRYEEGMKLIKKMETELKTAENKISKIKATFVADK